MYLILFRLFFPLASTTCVVWCIGWSSTSRCIFITFYAVFGKVCFSPLMMLNLLISCTATGEGDTASFKLEDLRTSRDWVNDSWIDLICNPDAVKAAAHLKPETPRIVNEVRTSIVKQPRALPVPLKVL
jgi:hypothetical protein